MSLVNCPLKLTFFNTGDTFENQCQHIRIGEHFGKRQDTKTVMTARRRPFPTDRIIDVTPIILFW